MAFMKYVKLFPLVLFIAAIFTACSKDKDETYIKAQETIIDQYWKSIDSTKFSKTPKEDIYRITEIGKEGDKNQVIELGDTVSFNYIGAILAGNGLVLENIFDTNIPAVAKDRGLEPSNNGKPYKVIIGKDNLIRGLEIGILQMCKDEQSYVFFTSRLGYGKKEMSIIPKYSPIIFFVKIVDVKEK